LDIEIATDELEFTYARSGGPGGQNVNKVNSKAVLRWRVADSVSLPPPVKRRFLERYSNRLTIEGDLILTSQKHRDQPSNTQECIEKLNEMVASVAKPPTPRRATRPTLASKKRRVDSKKQRSETKQQRRRPMTGD
jgi:ribosome-associated protein